MNHRLESRMREIRLSGSEGGGAGCSPYPYPLPNENKILVSANITV